MIHKFTFFVILLGLLCASLPACAAEILWPDSENGVFHLDASREVKEAYLSVIPTAGAVPARVLVNSGTETVCERWVNTLGQEMRFHVTGAVRQGKRSFTLAVQDGQLTFGDMKLMVTYGTKLPKAVFFESFENGSLDSISGVEAAGPENVMVVRQNAASGNYALKVRLNRTDPVVAGSKRAEIAKMDMGGLGREYWYAFSVYIPPDFIFDKYMEIIAQWHVAPDANLGEVWRSPPLSLKITGGEHFAVSNRWDPKPATVGNDPRPEGGMDDNMGLGKIRKGEYQDFVFHVKWSSGADGILEIYREDVMIFQRFGPNTYNDQSPHFMKLGVYKGAYLSDTDYGNTQFREYYFDDIKVFTQDEILADILPKKLPAAIVCERNGERVKMSFSNYSATGKKLTGICRATDPVSGRLIGAAAVTCETMPLQVREFEAKFPPESRLTAYVTDQTHQVVSNTFTD